MGRPDHRSNWTDPNRLSRRQALPTPTALSSTRREGERSIGAQPDNSNRQPSHVSREAVVRGRPLMARTRAYANGRYSAVQSERLVLDNEIGSSRTRSRPKAALWLGSIARTTLPSLVESFIIASSLKPAAVEQDETEGALLIFLAIRSSRHCSGVGVASFNRRRTEWNA